MDRSPDLPFATMPEPRASQMRPTRGPPASSEWALAGNGAAEEIQELTAERDRIAQRLGNVVVYRLFSAGLDLQAALGLIGDHPAADRIDRAIGQLDHAVRDLRDAIFDRAPATAVADPDGRHG